MKTSQMIMLAAAMLPAAAPCGIKFATARRPSARPAVTQGGGDQTASRAAPLGFVKERKVLSIMGRNVLRAMTAANTDRAAAGFGTVWPRTPRSKLLSDDREDISGMAFEQAEPYFSVLLDVEHAKTSNWKPYVNLDIRCLDALSDTGLGWSIAANVTDAMPDTYPLLISSNADPFRLVASWGLDDPIPFGSRIDRGGTGWADAFVAVVQKGGAVKFYRPGEFTKRNVMGGPVSLGTRYLSAPPPRAKKRDEVKTPAGISSSGSRWVMKGEQLASFDDIVIAAPQCGGQKNTMFTVKLKKPYFVFREVMVEVQDGRVRNLMFQTGVRQLRTESMAIGDAIAKDISTQCGIRVESDGRRCHREYKWSGAGFRSFTLNVNNENDDSPGEAEFTLMVGCGAN